MGKLVFYVPRTAANVIRSIGVRHQELAEETHVLADRLDEALRGPVDCAKLQTINLVWARGVRWCNDFAHDQDPLRMPGQVLGTDPLKV